MGTRFRAVKSRLGAAATWLSGFSRAQKLAVQISYDFVACLATGLVLSRLAFTPSDLPTELAAAAIGAAACALILGLFGAYSTVIRFMASSTTFIFAGGVAAGAAAWLLALRGTPVPAVPGTALYLGVSFLLVYGSRHMLRRAHEFARTDPRRVSPIAIYGAGATGRQLAATLASESGCRPVAFIDDDIRLRGLKVGELRTYLPSELPALQERFGIKEVVLAIPSASSLRRRQILETLVQNCVRVRTIPSLSELISGKATVDNLRAVNPEDVLGREPVPPNSAFLRHAVTGKSVLVTGGGGSIGSELCRQIAALDPTRLVILDMSEHALFQIDHELRSSRGVGRDGAPAVYAELGSTCNFKLVESVLRRHNIDTVFHAAAYKHVPLLEANMVEGVANNVFSTKSLLDAVAKSAVSQFLLVSSDKAVRPTNVMGASKRVAELLVQAAAAENSACRMSIVRFGNVLGSSGSVLPVFQSQILAGGPLTLTDPEMTRYFMTIPEAAQLILQAGALGEQGDVFHLDMGDPVRILDLARRLIRLNGLRDAYDGQEGDIEIRVVGSRPGEKIREELLICDRVEATSHQRIFRAREQYLSADELAVLIRSLERAVERRDELHVRGVLNVLVEGYASTESSTAAVAPSRADESGAGSRLVYLRPKDRSATRSAAAGPVEARLD